MKISLSLFAGFCLVAVSSGHLEVGGHGAVDADLHITGFGAGVHAKLGHGLAHEKHHDNKEHVEESELIKKMFHRKAEKPLLEKQKQLLTLLYHVQQDSNLPEHMKIADSFSPFNSYDSPLYLKGGVVEKFHDYWKYAPLAKGAIFSIYDQRHLEQAVALFKMFYYAKNFEIFHKTAVWARMNVNEGMFVYCLYVAVVHRADTKGIMLPPIYEVTPHLFFGTDVINKAQYYKQVHEAKQHNDGTDNKGYTIDSNYSNHHLNLGHEQTSLAYYLEDVGLNTFLYNLHINLPFWMNSTEFGWDTLPRGHLYYVFYQNIWTRYHLERFPYGYDDMENLDWDLPVETPYHSNLAYPNGMPFPNRPIFAKLHEYSYNYGQTNWAKSIDAFSHTYVKDIERRIADAASSGAIWNETKGELVTMESGKFINVLGNLIEGNHDSPNLHYYGPIWHYARHLLGYSTQQLDQNEVVPSALEHFETTMRDPVFYQLIKKLVIIPFQEYLAHLPPYTKDELMFNGVEVTSVEMDPLITFYEPYHSNLINSMFYKPHEAHGDFNVRVRQPRLNHKSFEAKIHVKSDKPQKASIKLAIGTKYDSEGRPVHINNVFLTPDKVSYTDLWQQTIAALEGDQEFTTDLRQNWFGFPKRFMIPKGSVGGTPYQFFFAVLPYTESHNSFSHNLDVIQVDNYPLSFPLDRFIKFDKMWKHMPNFHFEEVKVYFKEDDDSW
ncbi:hypothetical protein JTB14_010218 [Gonioctena quinquepunctata]|nr:hypothetical protein JTB14_010218 [Gonioctena quinquepunctata]